MTKTKLMLKLKDKFGGTYAKENGRWFWSKGKEKHLVTSGWLLNELKKPVPKPEVKSSSKKAKVVIAPEVVKEEVPAPAPVVEEVPPVVTEEVVNETPITE
jgi:hypothetical protein